MRRMSGQSGFTLVEMLVGMGMMVVVLMATLTVLDVFQKDYRRDQIRNETQDSARTAIDQMSRDLRSAASLCGTSTGTSCTGASSGALQRWTSTDIIFQAVSAGSAFGANDASNQEWVRYCLDSSGNLWREILAPTGSAALPSMPTTSTCPGDTTSWPSQKKIATNLTNTSSQSCPNALFCYYTVSTNSSGTVVSLPKSVQFYLTSQSNTNPNLTTQITGGVDLRNSLASPTSSFTCTSTGSVTCDGSGSSDPNGQTLEYQWYISTGSTGSCSGTVQATTEAYTPGALSGTYSISLQVTDTAGLNSCSTQTKAF